MPYLMIKTFKGITPTAPHLTSIILYFRDHSIGHSCNYLFDCLQTQRRPTQLLRCSSLGLSLYLLKNLDRVNIRRVVNMLAMNCANPNPVIKRASLCGSLARIEPRPVLAGSSDVSCDSNTGRFSRVTWA